MTKRTLLVILLFSLVAACSSDDVPKDVIPPDKMKLILYDVMRAESLAGLKYPKPQDTAELRRSYPALYQQVFSIYKITKEDFYHSFDYYESHPDIEKALFDSLSAVGEKKRRDMYMKMR